MLNNRIAQIRRDAGLTQKDFGASIGGLTQNYIWMLEKGERIPGDRTIADICRTYGVSEHWLRTGEGEMYIPLTRDEQIAEFVGDMLKDEDDTFKKRLVSVLARLNDSEWEMLEKVAEMLVEKGREAAKEKQSDSGSEAARD